MGILKAVIQLFLKRHLFFALQTEYILVTHKLQELYNVMPVSCTSTQTCLDKIAMAFNGSLMYRSNSSSKHFRSHRFQPMPRSYKTFYSQLSCAWNVMKIWRNSTLFKLRKARMLFFPLINVKIFSLLINVKMPTTVGILTLMNRKN